jgi:hypothetical protein
MHQDDDDDVVGSDEDLSFRPPTHLFALVFSPSALAIASLVVGFAGLTITRAADVIGQAVLFSSKNLNNGELTNARAQAVVQLVVGGVAVLLGLAAALRVDGPSLRFTDGETDEEVDDGDPLWVRALAGGAILVAVVAVLLAASALIEAEHVHLSKQLLNGG